MKKLTEREKIILEFVKKNKKAGNAEIMAYLSSVSSDVARVTVIRDINELIVSGLLKREGEGRGVYYEEEKANPLLSYLDPDEYFKKSPDERALAYERFNFNIFDRLDGLFSDEETEELERINKIYSERIKKLSPAIIKKEFERLTIELSWKSSQIEGNTYSLIDTETLIKDNKEAEGHKKEEAIMILNHKKALDYILDKKSDFQEINLRKIENIHSLVVDRLNVSKGLRKRTVGIVGTKYRPLDNEHQVKEAMEKMAEAINNKIKNPFSKALSAILMISYIQPFEDGNKRTARLLGNAILLAHNICPLSYRSVNESDYKKATLLFYEQNSARFFKELFEEQFKFAVDNYFLA